MERGRAVRKIALENCLRCSGGRYIHVRFRKELKLWNGMRRPRTERTRHDNHWQACAFDHRCRPSRHHTATGAQGSIYSATGLALAASQERALCVQSAYRKLS
jgi:hypothetical protein